MEYKIEDGKIVVALDLNADGSPSIKLEIDIMEAIKEAIAKLTKKDVE